MKEGKVVLYKNYQIIVENNSKKCYVYNTKNEEVYVTDREIDARTWVLKSLAQWDINNLEHDGVTIIPFLYNERIYLVSILNEYIEKYPNVINSAYFELNQWGKYQNAHKYFHNEKGPANYCSDTEEGNFYWKGTQLSKENWERAVHEHKFTNTWNELMND